MRKAQKIRSISQASLSSFFSLVFGGISSCDHPWEDVAKVEIIHRKM
jgi:hypothetical protein